MPDRAKFEILDTKSFVLLLAIFSFFTHCSHFLADGSLYWDTAKIYTEFRDNLQALNHFGEIAWWFPHTQTGFPGYYHSILGIPSLSNPIFALLGAVVWVLGKFGVLIHNFHPIYVTYFGFLVPILLLFSVRAIAQTLWTNPFCTGLALILTAFSPGITFHMSDIGYLEPTAYGLFFCAEWMRYCKNPDQVGFLRLALAAALVTLSGTHASLYWNAYFIPFFLIALFLVNRRIPLPKFSIQTFTALGIVLLPLLLNVAVFVQGRELVRSSIGLSQIYPFDRLVPGNPLEALMVSLPGVGFDWNSDRSYWTLMPLSKNYHSSFHYMGILALPLFFYALLKGGRTKRRILFSLFSLFFGVIVLSGFSPAFAAFLRLPTAFRSCNHFSDAALKAGGFLILIFGIVEGLRVFIRRKSQDTPLLLRLIAISTGLSLAITLYFAQGKMPESLPLGLLLFWTALFSTLAYWLRSESKKRITGTLTFFLLAVLLDISSQSYLWIRNIVESKVTLNSGWPAYSRVDESPAEDGIGLKVGKDRQFYTNILLMYPAYFQWQVKHIDPMQLPFVMAPTAQVSVERKTFNSLRLSFSGNQPETLFVRDAYSPYWKAWIDNQAVPIERMKENYKSVKVPAGSHSIYFQFLPPFVPNLLALSYLGILFLTIWSVKLRHRSSAVVNQKSIIPLSRDLKI